MVIANIQIHLVDKVRNPGYYMYQLLKNGQHINKLIVIFISNSKTSIGYVVNWTRSKLRPSFKLSSNLGLITVIHCYLEHQNTILTNSSKFKTWPAELYAI